MRLKPGIKIAASAVLSLLLVTGSGEFTAQAQSLNGQASLQNSLRSIFTIAAVAPLPKPSMPEPPRIPQPAPQTKTSGKHGWVKWVLIGAGAGVATAIIATRGTSEPVVTIGTPFVGKPQ